MGNNSKACRGDRCYSAPLLLPFRNVRTHAFAWFDVNKKSSGKERNKENRRGRKSKEETRKAACRPGVLLEACLSLLQ
jgi:hypothetical protein